MRSILILSADASLARLIQLEASTLGFSAVIASDVTSVEGYDCIFVDCRALRKEQISRFLNCFSMLYTVAITEDTAAWHMRERVTCLPYPVSLSSVRDALLACLTAGAPLPMATDVADRFRMVRYGSDVLLPGGSRVRLSDYELTVLRCLCRHAGQTVSRKELNRLLGDVESNMADVYVCHLRRKMARVTEKRIIETVRNQGYRTQYTLDEDGDTFFQETF